MPGSRLGPGQSSLTPIFNLVSADAPTDFVRRIRETAGSDEIEALTTALGGELNRISAAHAAAPEAWSEWSDGVDVLGTAYEALVPGAARRAAGQFQTPFWAADLMAGWLLQEPAHLLLDPGVGAGRLLFRASQRPEGRPGRYLGLDVDPTCLAMARLNLALREASPADLRQANFLLDTVSETPDAIICNPPYSRHHAIPGEEKAAIHDGLASRLSLRVSRLAGLHVLFLVRALEIAAEGARIAFITPAEWLDVNYGRAVKRFVLDHAHVEGLIVFQDDHLFFDGALTTAAITLLRKGAAGDQPTRILHLPTELPDVERVLAGLRGEGDLTVVEAQLDHSQKWSRRSGAPARGRPLGELARVRRGIATGCNEFFVISEATRRDRELSTADLRPCITSPRIVDGTELTREDLDGLPAEQPRWALDCRNPETETAPTPLGRYLRWGRRKLRAHAGYLARTRATWYALERRGASPILFTYMNRQNPRFIRNRAGAVALNTFLAVEPREGVDPDALCRALNEPAFLRHVADARRGYGGGLWKLEPKELEALRLPWS